MERFISVNHIESKPEEEKKPQEQVAIEAQIEQVESKEVLAPTPEVVKKEALSPEVAKLRAEFQKISDLEKRLEEHKAHMIFEQDAKTLEQKKQIIATLKEKLQNKELMRQRVGDFLMHERDITNQGVFFRKIIDDKNEREILDDIVAVYVQMDARPDFNSFEVYREALEDDFESTDEYEKYLEDQDTKFTQDENTLLAYIDQLAGQISTHHQDMISDLEIKYIKRTHESNDIALSGQIQSLESIKEGELSEVALAKSNIKDLEDQKHAKEGEVEKLKNEPIQNKFKAKRIEIAQQVITSIEKEILGYKKIQEKHEKEVQKLEQKIDQKTQQLVIPAKDEYRNLSNKFKVMIGEAKDAVFAIIDNAETLEGLAYTEIYVKNFEAYMKDAEPGFNEAIASRVEERRSTLEAKKTRESLEEKIEFYTKQFQGFVRLADKYLPEEAEYDNAA